MNDRPRIFFYTLLATLVLFLLRAFGIVSFSWWWVFFPLVLHIGIVIVFIILWIVIIFIACAKYPEEMEEFKKHLEEDETFLFDRDKLKKFFDEHFR